MLLLLAELQTIVIEYWNRMFLLEGDKHDLDRLVALKELEVILLYVFQAFFFSLSFLL